MRQLTMLLVALVVDFFLYLLFAWTAGTLWSWLIALQYGKGPTFASWFGIVAVTRLFTSRRQGDINTNQFRAEIGKYVIYGISLCVVLLLLGAGAHFWFGLGATP